MLSSDEFAKKYLEKLDNGEYEKDYEQEKKIYEGNGSKLDLSPEGIKKKAESFERTLDELATIWPEEFGDDVNSSNLCPDQVIGSGVIEEEKDCDLCPAKSTCVCLVDDIPAMQKDYFCKCERDAYFKRVNEEKQIVRTNVKKSNNIH